LQVSNQIYKLLAQNSFELRDFESYKTYTGLVKETNVQLEETFLKAQEKSLNYLLHKDENFMTKLTKLWLPISLMFILLILVFRKMYVRHKKSMKV